MEPRNLDSIVAVAQQRAASHPEKNYVTFLQDGDAQEASMSYLQLDKIARQVAGSFQKRGLAKGDRVLVILPNSLEFVQIFYGCLYGGILAVPLAEPAGAKHMEMYMETFVPTLKVSKPRLLIATEPMVNFLRTQLPPPLAKLFESLEIASDTEILNEKNGAYSAPEILPSDTAYLQFTSGSTGSPKGIMIGHSNVMANLEESRKFMEWEEGKGTGLWLPLFHDFGLAAGLMGALYSGGYVALMTPAHFIRKPLRWLAAMSNYRCSYSYVPPFALDLSVKKISKDDKKQLDLSCMVSVTDGSEPVHYHPTQQFNAYFADCGLKSNVIRPGFGMAEIVIMFSGAKSGLKGLCVNRHTLETEGKIELTDESAPSADKKYLVALGGAMDRHEIVIKGPNNEALPEGKVGELMVSGPSVAQGYYQNSEATEITFRQKIEGKEGVFLGTGDMALMWEGNLYFAGRIKDIIIIRGRNYYPQDIELAISHIEELRAGCILAYANTIGDKAEHLAVAMEVRADLVKDSDVFHKYVLPAIDQKVIEVVGQHFQIHPAERIYLQPGFILKTSSGKIKHQGNKKVFQQNNFEGLIARLTSSEEEGEVAIEESNTDLESEILKLFKKIIEVEPLMDYPIFECGGDSIMIVEFIETVEKQYKCSMDQVDEQTTLRQIIDLVKNQS